MSSNGLHPALADMHHMDTWKPTKEWRCFKDQNVTISAPMLYIAVPLQGPEPDCDVGPPFRGSNFWSGSQQSRKRWRHCNAFADQQREHSHRRWSMRATAGFPFSVNQQIWWSRSSEESWKVSRTMAHEGQRCPGKNINSPTTCWNSHNSVQILDQTLHSRESLGTDPTSCTVGQVSRELNCWSESWPAPCP